MSENRIQSKSVSKLVSGTSIAKIFSFASQKRAFIKLDKEVRALICNQYQAFDVSEAGAFTGAQENFQKIALTRNQNKQVHDM